MPNIIKCLLVISLFMYGCSANWHLKQSTKHKLKAIQLGAIITTDTVFSTKTVITKEVKTDTLFRDHVGDTVYLVKDNLKIKYVRMKGDTVFIEGKAERDTLKIIVPTTVTEVIHAPKPTFVWWQFLLAGFIFGIILISIIRRR